MGVNLLVLSGQFFPQDLPVCAGVNHKKGKSFEHAEVLPRACGVQPLAECVDNALFTTSPACQGFYLRMAQILSQARRILLLLGINRSHQLSRKCALSLHRIYGD